MNLEKTSTGQSLGQSSKPRETAQIDRSAKEMGKIIQSYGGKRHRDTDTEMALKLAKE